MASRTPVVTNPWEVNALNYQFPDLSSSTQNHSAARIPRDHMASEAVFYPGLYAPSGFDVVTILMHVMARSSPQIELGPVDCSVALVLTDLEEADQPIVYASEPFHELTGYSTEEVIGWNCRFLQQPPAKYAEQAKAQKTSDKSAVGHMRHSIRDGRELQLKVTNYKKNGQTFTNFLSIIPIVMGDTHHHYAVGLLVELE